MTLETKLQQMILEIEIEMEYYLAAHKNADKKETKLYCLGRVHSHEANINKLKNILSENSKP